MSAPLPKLAPPATPLPPGFGSPPHSSKHVKLCGTPSSKKPVSASVPQIPQIYELYPPRLPSAPDIPARVNPLCPPSPLRRTVMLETKQPHFQNDQRSSRMKQREHHRYHNTWSKYYYGSAVEQEAHRSYIRGVLKKQMEDADNLARFQFKEKVKESVDATQRDNQTRFEDARDFFSKYQYLKTFRDANKSIMEIIWDDKKQRKREEDLYDREQLTYNPINWSCTLK